MENNSSAINDYITKSRAAGLSDEIIKNELKKSDWDDNAIFQAFRAGPTFASAPSQTLTETNTNAILGLIFSIIFFQQVCILVSVHSHK